MIHVALDTSIYRNKPRLNSPEFKALVFLAKNECLCLHIPFFVENEFKSQIEIEQQKRVESVLAILNKICGLTEQLGTKTSDLINVIQNLCDTKSEIVEESGNIFIQWASEINAIRYGIDEEETIDALSAYFKGQPPLKEPKVRKDIPDSFIFQSLLRMHKKNHMHVVVEDTKLRGACFLDGMTCYKNLSIFIESEEVKRLLQGKIDSDVLGALESEISEFLNNNRALLIDRIEEKLLSESYNMISGDLIPGESNEIYVSGVDKPHEIEFSDNVEHYGDSLFVVDFSAKVEFLYEYAVYKSEAYELDPKKYYLESLNEHYFNVETTDEFIFRGRIELGYDIDLESIGSVAELIVSLSEPALSIEELDGFEIGI